jgi:cytoskeletal protein CcmA (bactofilin family)
MTLFNRDKSEPQKPQSAQQQPHAKIESAAKPAEARVEVLPPLPVKPGIQTSTSTQTINPTKTGATMASVISKALKITGELESTEDIQIDGQIEGDVRGVGVKIGQNAKVKGTVYGDEVELAGTIEGRIEAKKVVLASTARMTGDVAHQDIKIESGAYINGSLKPELGKSEAKTGPRPVAANASISPASAGNATAAALAHH